MTGPCDDTARGGHFPGRPMAPCPGCGSCSYVVGAGADLCFGCATAAREAGRRALEGHDPDGCVGAAVALVLSVLLFWGPLLYWLIVR